MTDAQPTPSAAAPQQPVVIERTYPASVSELWNLWTTKTGFASWWGPEGFRVEVHTLDARAGGALHYDMIADTPEAIAAMNSMGQPLTHSTHGWFADFTPETRLVLMHKIDFVRGMAPYDSKVDVDFQPVGRGSRAHGRHHSPPRGPALDQNGDPGVSQSVWQTRPAAGLTFAAGHKDQTLAMANT